ncbi:Telomere length regulator protein rif1 like [Verticillium longisporum]|uniref:Telomere length regulator protein rif1 like n=1 Tax=Verticillium longisporum TaxID=100787 RepID=A0A8I2ZRD6_VERLO|nr:Telomere length regulator protein rif1 like [Verticillium longisporum]
MGSVEASTRLLQLDEPRPPTPPREARLGADTNAAKPLLVRAASADSRSELNTPPGLSTPDPSTNNTNPNTSRSRKRVGFTALLEAPRNTLDKKGRRSSPPSASQPRPAKGILKITASPSPHELSLMADDSELLGPAKMSDMLESTVRQLAGTDRDAKTDAYMMLVRALQASNNLPDRVALQSKMGLFVQFIQRDIVAKTPAGTSDSPLISKALTLLDTFLFFPAIASTIPSDFGIFIVDHCIRSFEDPALPKDLARRLMHVMAKQDFPLRVMTSDRIKRLVSALHAMDGPSRGKMVVVSRLRIYARLMIQTKAYMAVHTEWLNDVLTDMLSSVKDVRNSAIKLGFEASFVFGREKLLQRKFMDLLEMSIEEMTYIEWYHAQLQEMIKGDSQDKAAVPKIWSVIILLLQYPLNKWRYFNPSLMIIQKCFNVAESNREANYAWNRYVYTAHLDEPTFHKVLPTLFMPLASQLSKSTVSPVKRELVMGGLCNLYYYAFKPNTNPAHLDAYWDVSVQPLTDALVPSANIPDTLDLHLQRATAILIGLLDSSTLRIWRDDRIKDSPIAKPEELPVIDSKWVRRNAPRVFKVISPIMDKHFCQLADRTSSTHKLWRALVGSVAFAASKEIKVSTDTATFVSEMFGLLLKHWQTGISIEGDTAETARQFVRAVQEMVLTAVESLGLLPFTEKMISLGRLSSFVPVATPSHRPGKNLGDVRSPLQHLFGLFSRLPPGIPDDETYLQFLRAVFSPFFSTTKSAKARSELATEMLQAVPIWSPTTSFYPYGPWVFASESMIAAMSISQSSIQTTSSSGDTILGHEYRSIARMLERGWKETPNLPLNYWNELYTALANRAVGEVGEPGKAIGVIEPLAKMIRETLPADSSVALPPNAFRVATELLSSANHPQDRHALEAARRRVWGTAVTGSIGPSFDPFDHLYQLVDHLLLHFYALGSMEGLAEVATPFFGEISDFLLRCNPALVLRTITNLESGMSVWIQDQQGILSSRRDVAQAEAVKKLWTTVCGTILSGEQPQLESFEMLLCAGFESKHRQIVNTAAETWNRVFEAAGDVQYPERLKAVLLSSHARSTPKSRLRHDDSQLHFTPVESSPLAGAKESQVLTERQQEVRERQKDAAAIFPGLRSSPLKHEAAAQQLSSKAAAAEGRKQRQRDVTPEGRAEEEEYVISTPTPRRGQAMAMIVDDQDMTDPPSSPPEPRPFPLLPHLKTRSSLGEVDQDWPMSSSPVNGSPVVSKEHTAANEIPVLDITGDENHNPSSLDTHGSEMVIDDSFQMEVVPSSVASETRLPTHRKEVVVMDDEEAEDDDDEPSTPRAREDVDDAKSDEPDIFVDALTSPQQPLTRSAKKALERQADAEKDGSFVMSDGDENSMLRLVVELDSRRCKLPINRHPAESPSKHEDVKEVLDCITVVAPEDDEDEEDEAQEKPRRKPKSKSRSPGRSQSVVEMSAPPSASETSSNKKKKRKRSAVAREESTNKKAKPSQEGRRSRQTSVLTDRSAASSFCSDSHAGDAQDPSSPGHPSTPAKETRARKASVTPRRRSRRISSDEKDTDTELESQLAAEQIAASRSQSLAVEEAVALSSTSVSREASMDLSHDVTPRASQSVAIPTVEENEEQDEDESQKPTMLDSLSGVLAQLKSATLSRDEVYKMEDVLMDIKRELFAAEKRGRA